MRDLPASLSPLATYRQFIVYRIVPSITRPGKLDKFPCDHRTGSVSNAHDHSIWADYKTAINAAARLGADCGVGFVFTENDPFWFLDLDNCLLPSGEWSEVAKQLCQVFAGCAVEISVSGRGLHIFGTGRLPAHRCESALGIGGLYHTDRFVALTGNGAQGNAAHDASGQLQWLVDSYFKPESNSSHSGGDFESPSSEWNGPEDDDELVRLALNAASAASAFGGKASFKDLWEANVEVLGRLWPSDNRLYDASSADAALAQHLAFWTGRHAPRIRELMLKSALRREKWNREDYMQRTIYGACSRQSAVYSAGKHNGLPISAETGNDPYYVKLNEDTFKGCVYISSINSVYLPDGRILKQEAFKIAFGCHSYTLDPAGTKVTDDAWKAFTNNHFLKPAQVDSVRFYPDRKPGEIIVKDGVRYLNIYTPISVPRKVGDATPFFTHLTKVLPDARDRQILLNYMAACVQHIGTKFQWAPLIQGVEGNGKTLFTRCVAAAIGERYTHFPPASELGEKFNSWLFNKLFIGVEDIYVPDKRREVIEILKPMITSENLARRAMQTDQEMYNVVANFIFNSNHRNAVPKTANERRFCILFCAQQNIEDIRRDGMDDKYFSELYRWLRSEGYAIVSELLYTMPIDPELNPAGTCQRAPKSSTTEQAIAASMGSIEQEIQEHVAQGQPGFRGGWISSIMLGRMLEKLGADKRMTHSNRVEILERLGYIKHPGLIDGRVNNPVSPDGGKPRLFVLKHGGNSAIRGATEIAKAYEVANTINLFDMYK